MDERAIIVVINPGSTSTKVAVYSDEVETMCETLQHDSKTLSRYADVWSQFNFRLCMAQEWLQRLKDPPSAVVGIGGLLRPVPSGTYAVNEAMLKDAKANLQGAHPSNLGCAMALELARNTGCPAFVVDPVSVDEFLPLARYSGHPLIERKSLSHALNIHAMARKAAKEIGIPYEHTSFVVAHLGGGISIAPVRGGKIIDANDASSDGPFSPERTGGLPLQQFIGLCFSGHLEEEDARALVMGNGGLKAYLGTNSAYEIERRIAAGDEKAREVYEAMGYQIAKEIGAMATVLSGEVDSIVLTGGMARSSRLISTISSRIARIARILSYPGENEMLALAQGALRVLRGEEQAQEY